MPFPFTLPTTSSFSFSSSYGCDSHPSLPLTASTYRGVVRDELKKHKRLPPASQSPHISSVAAALNNYLPYLIAINDSLMDQGPLSHEITVALKTNPTIEWRPTLSDNTVPGREIGRVKIISLEHELAFTLSTLAGCHTLIARSALHPLYMTTTAVASATERTTAIQTAAKNLLDTASIYDYLATRSETHQILPPPCVDISPPMLRGLASLAHAEATLLAVLKDDPYPAVIAQSRNETDKEWMYKAPTVPKVRASLFARLCLAAAEHASKASSLCSSSAISSFKPDDGLLRYIEDTRRTARARACRFFGIDAELGGEMGQALAWLRAGLHELGVEGNGDGSVDNGKKPSALGRLKKGWVEKREDRKVEKETSWGADGGKLEETRVIEYLEEKWDKYNMMIHSQSIPPIGPMLAQLPSGREIHTIPPFKPPQLERNVLNTTRAPPDRRDELEASSGDEATPGGHPDKSEPVGAFPGTRSDYGGSSTPGYY